MKTIKSIWMLIQILYWTIRYPEIMDEIVEKRDYKWDKFVGI